jgi:predicted ATPase
MTTTVGGRSLIGTESTPLSTALELFQLENRSRRYSPATIDFYQKRLPPFIAWCAERGDLVRDDKGYWVEGTRVDWERLPARVEGIIAERIGRLDESMREVLTVACIEGESFTAEVVARVQGIDPREMVQLLSSDLDRRLQLVRPVGTGQVQGQRLSHYRFRHLLFQQYLYQYLDEHERVYLHEEIGTALEVLYGEQVADLAVQLARHFAAAEQSEKTVRYLLLAVQRFLQMSAHHETIVHCQHGLALLATLPDTTDHAQIELVQSSVNGNTDIMLM